MVRAYVANRIGRGASAAADGRVKARYRCWNSFRTAEFGLKGSIRVLTSQRLFEAGRASEFCELPDPVSLEPCWEELLVTLVSLPALTCQATMPETDTTNMTVNATIRFL